VFYLSQIFEPVLDDNSKTCNIEKLKENTPVEIYQIPEVKKFMNNFSGQYDIYELLMFNQHEPKAKYEIYIDVGTNATKSVSIQYDPCEHKIISIAELDNYYKFSEGGFGGWEKIKLEKIKEKNM
jgi:hypothetical protein